MTSRRTKDEEEEPQQAGDQIVTTTVSSGEPELGDKACSRCNRMVKEVTEVSFGDPPGPHYKGEVCSACEAALAEEFKA